METTMITLPIYAAAAAAVILALQVLLMASVGFARLRSQQLIGNGDNVPFLLIVRRHGNLAENSGIFIAALALLEMVGGAPMVVAAIAGTFVVARVGHAIGMTIGEKPNAGRALGAGGTLLCGLAISGYLLALVGGRLF